MPEMTQNWPTSASDIIGLLRERDILPTQQRVQIAQVLFAQPQHLSADQVLSLVNQERYVASKATVYNTLGLFASKGLIRQVIVDPNRVFYDPNTSDHHHFYNVDTGTLTDIDAGEVDIGQIPNLPRGTEAEGVDVIIRVKNAHGAPAE